MTLLDEAKAAYDAQQAAQEAAAEAERKALRAAALDALKAVLVRPDGTALTLTDLAMTRVHADVDPATKTGIVVWSDGTLNVAAQLEAGQQVPTWRVRLVEQDTGAWVAVGDRRIRNLAELYAAYVAAG